MLEFVQELMSIPSFLSQAITASIQITSTLQSVRITCRFKWSKFHDQNNFSVYNAFSDSSVTCMPVTGRSNFYDRFLAGYEVGIQRSSKSIYLHFTDFYVTQSSLEAPVMGSKNVRELQAVVIPFPAQGHVTPALQLSKKLVALHGFRITFVNTTHVHEKLMKLHDPVSGPNHNGIEFVAVSDGLPDDQPRLRDFTAFMTAGLKMGPVFEELFVKVRKKAPISCIIVDMAFTTPVHRIATSLGIPVSSFVTPSAISAHCRFNIDKFISAGILPLPPPPDTSAPSMDQASMTLRLPQTEAEAAVRNVPIPCLVPGASPTMRVEDLPTFMLSQDLDNFFIRYSQNHINPFLPDSICVLVNTFSELEGDVLSAMVGSLNDNVLAVGPLVLQSAIVNGVEEVKVAGVESGLLEEDPVSLSWLDDQKPSSVLFVSFGSIATASVEQMSEYAAGLEASNVPFLWVVRSDLIADLSVNEEFETMFTGFVKRTRERALLVSWAPQTAVLSHAAVGAFLTHCGWNSILESICTGVPMLGWPRLADQTTNCDYVTSVWKIGLEVEKTGVAEDGSPIAGRDEVVEKVKSIISDSATAVDIRERCRSLQMAARRAVGHGGSSQGALASLWT